MRREGILPAQYVAVISTVLFIGCGVGNPPPPGGTQGTGGEDDTTRTQTGDSELIQCEMREPVDLLEYPNCIALFTRVQECCPADADIEPVALLEVVPLCELAAVDTDGACLTDLELLNVPGACELLRLDPVCSPGAGT